MEQEVYLGFVDEPVINFSWTNSKIGGYSIFPDGKKRDSKCRLCGRRTSLLAQIYCPVDNDNHRLLYIFSCLAPSCAGQNDGWHIFRLIHPITKELTSPKPKQDDIFDVDDDWGTEGASDWGTEDTSDLASKGDKSNLTDSGGDKSEKLSEGMSMLSIEHTELIEVTEYEGKCFDEFYIAVTEDKKEKKNVVETERAHELLKKYKQENQSSSDIGSGGDNFLQEEYEDFQSRSDKTFFKFVNYLSENPEQIIRYSYCGLPQLAAPVEDNSIPKCSCGQERVYELQLTPHLITSLAYKKQSSQLDFATVLIYTCGADCQRSEINTEVGILQHDPDSKLYDAKIGQD